MGLLFLILFCVIPGLGISAGLWAIGNHRSKREGLEESSRQLPSALLRRDIPFLIVVVGLVGGALLAAFGGSARGLSVVFVLAAVACSVLVLVRKRLPGRALWAERVARTLASTVITILTTVVAVAVVLIVAFITNPPTD